MAESVTDWLRGYVSCIKINGKPILPPLMTPERYSEMRQYKEMAVAIETALDMKRNSVDSGVICPSSRSSSWGNRKSLDINENAISRNVNPSASEEETLLFELMEECTADNSKKEHETSPEAETVSSNASEPGVSTREDVRPLHRSSLSMDMNVFEVHNVAVQGNKTKKDLDQASTKPADVRQNFAPPKAISLSHSEHENTLYKSSNVQSEAKCISPKTAESVLLSSGPQDKTNFGTSSPVHRPVLQITSPIAESATQCCSQTADEVNIPVKKIHASLNISEIVPQDDIIQDGLGFKVWNHSCEVLKSKPQHSSTPAEESSSTTESNRIENLDGSVSSVVPTESTDLNNYMSASASSKSFVSVQSSSSIAPAVLESEIVKQTSDNSQHSSDESKQAAHSSFSKSTPESQLRNLADNFGIDGIQPLDLENEAGQLTTPGVVETVKQFVEEKPARSIESNESGTSSNSSPPRLKRELSYVLESPSPLLVEHLKSCKYDGDMTHSPTRKMLNSSEIQQRVQKLTLLKNPECNVSLPNSSVSSPIKLQTPFASSECLSPTVPKEKSRISNFDLSKSMLRKICSSAKENFRKSRCISSETQRRFSAEEAHGKKNVQKTLSVPSPRCGSFDNLSTAASRKSGRIVMKSPKMPQKMPKTSTSKQPSSPTSNVTHVECVSQNHSTESLRQLLTPSGTPERLSAQEDLRELFLQLQTAHQQQMTELVEKQKREQEAMREAFRQQQNQLMNEIRSICPEVFSTPESHKLLAKSFTQPLSTDVAVALKGIKNDESPNNSAVENITGSLQENITQKQANPRADKNFVNKNDDGSSGSHYLDDASFSELQNLSTSVSEVGSSGIIPSQEAHQIQPSSSLPSEHGDLSNVGSSAHRNNAAQHMVQHVSNVDNSTNTSDIIEAIARENTSFSSEISSKRSDMSRSMITESSASVEYSDSVVASTASGSKVTQQMSYSVHTNGTVINNICNVDVAEVSKQVCRSKPSLSQTADPVMLANDARTSDLNGNTVALYGLTADGKVVSSMLTVAKSEVILSDGLPYLEPREETVRTTVFTRLNGVDHNGMVNAHFSTVMHGARQSCSRELFPARSRFGVNYTIIHERAATRIQAGVRGYLTRRLFRTARVQDLITTIRDTLLCAVQLSQECWPDVRPEDVALHGRLIQQVTAACYALHDVFFSLPISEQMAIIAADREKQRGHASRTALPRPLSAATQRALERKARLSEHEGRLGTGRSRRTWFSGCDNPSGSYGIARSCLLRQQQQQMSAPQQMAIRSRRSGSSSGRRPWR